MTCPLGHSLSDMETLSMRIRSDIGIANRDLDSMPP